MSLLSRITALWVVLMLAILLATRGKTRRRDMTKIDKIVRENEQGIGKALTDPEPGAPGGGKLME